MNICTIYVIKNTINDKVYIGQTWCKLNKRFSEHKGNKSGSCRKLFRAFNQHGRDNFYIEQLYNCDNQIETDMMEDYYIKKYNSIKSGYNIREGGSKGKLSKETKTKMSLAAKGNKKWLGKKHSKESKTKISLSNMGKNIGKKHSEETKTKMSLAKIGNKNSLGTNRSEETKRKISLAMIGNKNGLVKHSK